MAVDPAKYPNLINEGYSEESPETSTYNCIAWAAADQSRWWWPAAGNAAYWPRHVPRDTSIDSFVQVFESLGYELCANGNFENGYEKVAIYAVNDDATHAARQLLSGRWTHKLGNNVDIETTLRGVESTHYGRPVRYLRRRLPGS